MAHPPAGTQACDRPERWPNPNGSESIAYDVQCQHCDGWLCISCGHDHVDGLGQICDPCGMD